MSDRNSEATARPLAEAKRRPRRKISVNESGCLELAVEKARVADSDGARVWIGNAIRRRLDDLGLERTAIPLEDIWATESEIYNRLRDNPDWEVDPEVAMLFRGHFENLLRTAGVTHPNNDEELVAPKPTDELYYVDLLNEFEELLQQRIQHEGKSEANSAFIARAVAAEFGKAANLTDRGQIHSCVEAAIAALRTAPDIKAEFERAANPTEAVAAPARWVDRDSAKFPTAESFLRYHFGPRLGIEGDLTLAEIGRYDTPLLTALNREFKGRRHELHVLLPTVTDRANQRLLEKYGYVPQGSDRKSKLAMMSLQRKPNP